MGPESLMFSIIRQNNKELLDDYDDWKYISLCDKNGITFDFVIPSRSDCIRFIIAISNAAGAVNKKFFGVTNHRFIAS